LKFQIGTSKVNGRRGGVRKLPYVFTEDCKKVSKNKILIKK
jgi:hypothetical protein